MRRLWLDGWQVLLWHGYGKPKPFTTTWHGSFEIHLDANYRHHLRYRSDLQGD